MSDTSPNELGERILDALRKAPAPLRGVDVARAVGLTAKKDVNSTLYRLEKKGLVCMHLEGQTPMWRIAGSSPTNPLRAQAEWNGAPLYTKTESGNGAVTYSLVARDDILNKSLGDMTISQPPSPEDAPRTVRAGSGSESSTPQEYPDRASIVSASRSEVSVARESPRTLETPQLTGSTPIAATTTVGSPAIQKGREDADGTHLTPAGTKNATSSGTVASPGGAPGAAIDANLDSKTLYNDAMKNGSIKRTAIKCLIVGAAGVGKTCIKHLILGKEPPKKRESTGVIENPTVAVSVSQPASRGVSISRAGMKSDGSWYVVDDNKDLMKVIADLIKAAMNSQARSNSTGTGEDQTLVNKHHEDSALKEAESPGDSIQEDIIPKIIEAKGWEELLNTTWIHFIDSGGQPEFHDLLPAFIPDTSVVLYVLKMTEGLNEKPKVEYYGRDGPMGHPRESHLTHEEILKHSLKVFSAQGEQCSKILVIGTHKDCPEQRLSISELHECLKGFKQNVVNFGPKQPIALVDCFSREVEEEIVKDIRSHILENVEEEETPIAWFGLELALKKLSENAQQKGVLSYDQCKMEANKFEYFKSTNGQFEAALQHLVKHNIFLYYPETLPDIVFCDPQVLITMVTQTVEFRYMLNKRGYTGEMVEFVENAYISTDILEHISSQYKQWGLPPESFLKLLSYLKITCKVDSSNKYLMPALLQNVDNPAGRVETFDGKELLAPLCISFDGGCAPNGVFCSLIATLLQAEDWKLCIRDGIPRCCFRNCVTFTYLKKSIITLIDFFSYFSLYVYIPSHGKAPCPFKIRNVIHEFISEVAKSLHLSKLKLYDAIRCPAHPKSNHVALWEQSDGEDYYQCTTEDTCTDHLPPDYDVWKEKTAERPTENGTTERLVQDQSTRSIGPDTRPELKLIYNLPIRDWQGIGLELSISDYQIKVIEKDHVCNVDAQKREMLSQWLVQDAKATYAKLASALHKHDPPEIESVKKLESNTGIHFAVPSTGPDPVAKQKSLHHGETT